MSGPRLRLVLPLHGWLLMTHLLVLVLPVLALVGTDALGRDLRQQTLEDVDHQAALLALSLGRLLEATPEAGGPAARGLELSALLAAAKAETLAGFRLVDTRGAVVASSGDGLGEVLDDLEVEVALAGGDAAWEEARDPRGSRAAALTGPSRRAAVRVFVAAPVFVRGEVVGALVVSRTPREEVQAFVHMAPRLSAGAAAALLATCGLALSAGFLLSRSLRGLAAASHRMARGELDAVGELAPAHRSHVAEARELALAMGTMATRLQARLRYIREFAGHVSHEFKTPVSSLLGTVELLRDDDEMPPAQRARFLDNAHEDLDRLSRLVGGLLRLARAEEGGDRRVLALHAVADACLGRRPDVRREGSGGLVDGNLDQLCAAVDNLLDNARRYGGPGAAITLRLWARGAEVGLDVEDDGPGISAANLPRVFERFFTTGRDQGGTGLGLALVQAVAQAHGGRVAVQSAPGRTRFTIALPRAGGGSGSGAADPHLGG
jgi:signal transduction histidine kinase